MFDLIVADVDGTLLDSKGRLPSAVISAVREARLEGVQVTIATGRSQCSLQSVMNDLEIDILHVGACGGYLAEADGRVIIHRPLTKEQGRIVVESAYRELEIWGVNFQNIDLIIGDPKGYAWMSRFIPENIICVDDLLADEVSLPTKIDIMGASEQLIRIKKHIHQQCPDLNITSELSTCMEVTAPGVNKGWGVAYLCERLGIDRRRVAAIGDGFNDVSMFEVAAFSIAMGNAHPEVKQRADCVAPSNDSTGAAWAIKEILRRNAEQRVYEESYGYS